MIPEDQIVEMREQLRGLADVRQVSELVTWSAQTAAGAVVVGLVDIPGTLDTSTEGSGNRADGTELVIKSRRSQLPDTIPALNKTHQIVVTDTCGASITYALLRMVQHNALGTVYRLELRRTQGAIYG